MGTVLMTNPPRATTTRRRRVGAVANPPGLALAVIGNPGRRSTSQGTTMKKKRSSNRRARRAATIRRTRTPTRTIIRRRATPRRRRALSPGLGAAPALPSTNPSRKYWRVGKRIPWKNPSRAYWRVGSKTPWKNPRRRRRNPPAAVSGGGVMSDFSGLGSALAAITKQPMGLAWAGGGAAVTAVGGNLVAAQVAKVMPAMGPGLGRMVNAAVFAGVAVGASRLIKNPRSRRQMMAGGLAVAAIELLAPGKTYAVAAKVPVINRLLPSPMIGADPTAALARRGLAGGYDDQDGVSVMEDEPVAIDGIADDDDPSATFSNSDESTMGELVPTYLDGLGCPLGGRSNELTKLVTP